MIEIITPEAQELQSRHELLEKLENELAEKELNYQNLNFKLVNFEQRYSSSIGRLYAELDRLNATIAQCRANELQTPELYEAAKVAADTAKQSAFEAGILDENESYPLNEVQEFLAEPSIELKQLYKKAAMKFHPDRTTNEAERNRRTILMSQLNNAYGKNDEATVKLLIEKAASDPDEVTGEDFGSQLVRAIRKQSQISKRIQELDVEITQLQNDELYILMQSVLDAEMNGSDPLKELATNIQIEIAETKVELENL